MDVSAQIVGMVIKDFGCGIPADVRGHFQTSGTNVGVGLGGMEGGYMNSAVNSTVGQVLIARL